MKKKKEKRKKKTDLFMLTESLHYYTLLKRVPVIFYYTNLY